MNSDKTPLKIFFLTLVLHSLINGNPADAGRVKIINKSDLNLRIDAVSDPAEISYCKSCFDKQCREYGKHSAEIIIPATAFGSCGYFSIVDMRSGFLGSGKCEHLSVLKNYEVTFFETTFGTSCTVQEI